jgi:hypothetical protein
MPIAATASTLRHRSSISWSFSSGVMPRQRSTSTCSISRDVSSDCVR